MIRFILVAGFLICFLLFSSGVLYRLKKLGEKDWETAEWKSLNIVKRAFSVILKVSGVKVTVKGTENIPPDRPVLYVGNHRSYFDILVGYTTVPGLLGFVAKKEMIKWPFLSQWMVQVNCLFMDRENVKEGLKTILQGIEKIKRGVSIWIFPEGTRNRNASETELLPFKEGSLKIAEKSGCPVIPVAITGTADIFEKHIPIIRPAHVTIEFGEPFIVKELSPEQRKFPGAYTRERILEMLEREQNGLTGNKEEAGQD